MLLLDAGIVQLARRGVTIRLIARTVALRPLGLPWLTTSTTPLNRFHLAVRPLESNADECHLMLVGQGEPFVVSESFTSKPGENRAGDELAARLGPPFA